MLNIEKYRDEFAKIYAKDLVDYSHSEEKALMYAMQRIFNEYSCEDQTDLTSVISWCFAEYKKQILTNQEKAYLSAVIKPFRDKVRYILKISDDDWAKEYIIMFTNELGNVTLPRFDKNTMYKGMKLDRYYELEELGL